MCQDSNWSSLLGWRAHNRSGCHWRLILLRVPMFGMPPCCFQIAMLPQGWQLSCVHWYLPAAIRISWWEIAPCVPIVSGVGKSSSVCQAVWIPNHTQKGGESLCFDCLPQVKTVFLQDQDVLCSCLLSHVEYKFCCRWRLAGLLLDPVNDVD